MNSPATVTLRPTTEADLGFVLAAEQAPDNRQFVGQWCRDRHQQACQHANERHQIVWSIASDRPVGYVLLLGIEDPNQCLLIKRIVITEKGKGYGRATLQQVLAQAFQGFQAHRVWLDVMHHNHLARRLYRQLGFVEEGCLRESMKTDDGFVSMVVMAMLRSEYFSLLSGESLTTSGAR